MGCSKRRQLHATQLRLSRSGWFQSARGDALVILTAEQHEKLAQAWYKAAYDKKVLAEKRLEYRGGAKRHRLLAKLAKRAESTAPTAK